MHNLVGSLPHQSLRNLAMKYGPLMHLQLSEVSNIIVSSPEMAKESIREEEVSKLVETIYHSSYIEGSVAINLSEKIYSLNYGITARTAFGEKSRDQEAYIEISKKISKLAGGFYVSGMYPSIKMLQWIGGLRHKLDKDSDQLDIPLTDSNIKAVLLDIFTAGSEATSTLVEWAMSEMLKNPRVMKEAQSDVRRVFHKKPNLDERQIHELKYLRAVIRETLRLHPPAPLLLPRESSQSCVIDGHDIPIKARVIVNAWAIGRDPVHWIEAEKFWPLLPLQMMMVFILITKVQILSSFHLVLGGGYVQE
ncbi:hypothetical protein FNV43_RR00232 [Rhamnella rubrinervis]|uniref:Cytochrome P450 n=1 Tax=Rhamnella rubrinervis TaxID=2594499 RepID=A0A8K0HP63_9ROSA|nr:hypothetical protein FNV43_RR00232 [Rhamnella rubrinervis]